MLKRFNLKNSYDKVKFLQKAQILIGLLAFVLESYHSRQILNLTFYLQLIVLIVTYNFFYQGLKFLHYSYWNLSFILFIYYSLSAFRNLLVVGDPFVGFMFLTATLLLLTCSWIISSPLYFPRVNWWEYDFRFRADLKVWVDVDGKKIHGRLSDLRRGAGCLELFEHFHEGDKLQIFADILNQNFYLKAEIRSKREPIIGRSVVYGIKFMHQDLESKQRLRLLTNYWNQNKKLKISNKFSLAK